jgi:hypothetical protein
VNPCRLVSVIKSDNLEMLQISLLLFAFCFTTAQFFFTYNGNLTITGEGLQNLSLCSALRVSEQEESLLCYTSVFSGPTI